MYMQPERKVICMQSRGPKAFALSALLALSMATSPALAVAAEMPMDEAGLPSATSNTVTKTEGTQKQPDAKTAPAQSEPTSAADENLAVDEPLAPQDQLGSTELQAQTDAININAESVTVSDISVKSYTGSPIEPKPTIKDGDKTLVEGTDYTLSYKNNINETKAAEVIITGTGAYTGTRTVYFEIFGKGCGVSYQTHVQNIGDQGYKSNGVTSGTEGQSLRLEAIQIHLDNAPYSGGIEYQTHIQNQGWEKKWASNNAISGTQKKSLRLECIRIRLTGEMANNYHVWYRVHAENVGWMGWTKDGADAGTTGYGRRLEAIQILVLPLNAPAPGNTDEPFKFAVTYRTHVQNQGWQAYKTDGETSGTEGKSLRLEGIEINVDNSPYQGNIQYLTHVQNQGWETDWRQNGKTSGTMNKSLRLEAIKIRLTDDLGDKYDVWYRVHAQNVGWMGWAKNGDPAGTEGYSQRLEAIQIQLVLKGGEAPGSTENAYQQK